MGWVGADEGPHDAAPGLEGWTFEFAGPAIRGRIRLTFDRAHRCAGYLADLVPAGGGRLVVADDAVGLPRPAAGLEVRADGLWALLHCETPFEHWTLGLEAFGLRIAEEDLAMATTWDSLVGERLPVGFDLEWELWGPPVPLADGEGYAQDGVIHGEVLVERDRIAVEVRATREHWWGGAPGGLGGLVDRGEVGAEILVGPTIQVGDEIGLSPRG
jgi:hypothetical protein